MGDWVWAIWALGTLLGLAIWHALIRGAVLSALRQHAAEQRYEARNPGHYAAEGARLPFWVTVVCLLVLSGVVVYFAKRA